MEFCESVKRKYKNYETEKDLDTLRWFMTYHGKPTSYWYFKIYKSDSGHIMMQQKFFDGAIKKYDHVHFSFSSEYHFEELFSARSEHGSHCESKARREGNRASSARRVESAEFFEFCLVGELIEDNYSNRIFLIQDILSQYFIDYNLTKKHNLIHDLVDKIVTTSLDPFLIQVKILYPYDSQTLDIFFKTILISYNVDMEAILIFNDFGWENIGNFQVIECKNRVNLNMDELTEFISGIPEIKIVNHIMDFYERTDPALSLYRHNDEKIFYTKRDADMNPDIYMLYESQECIGPYQLALIPSMELSVRMNQMPNEFVQKYAYHEYHQKWIPIF